MKNNIIEKPSILHITPHLGGGVGKVLLNYLTFVQKDKKYSHSIATLDYANEKSKEMSKIAGFELFSDMYQNLDELLMLVQKADIVLIHFWNHPLLYDFLIRNELPPSRVIFWSHISGFSLPYVFTPKVLNYPDKFVFTTPISFETKEIKEFPDKSKLSSIFSTGGVEHFKNITSKPHKNFNIGYIGTVDYIKMHPDFLQICSKINIPDVKFIVCGGAKHLEIQKQAKRMGIADKFEFLGEIKDITKYLEIFDVFGYPLNSEHYGTCDQVLQEAMAAGIVPVVFGNPMENSMLKDGESGIIAKNKEDYISAIENLYKNPKYKNDLLNKTKEYAISTYSLKTLSNSWDKIYEETIKIKKNSKNWDICIAHPDYFDIFLESLGDYKHLFMLKSESDRQRIKELGKMPNWQSETKGTVHQYYEFFKSNEKLKKISELMKQEDN